jgi:starvation-inducible DNA-binding protein
MLTDKLKSLLGTTFTFYVKIHGFHFNIEGTNFPQYHAFLGDFYADVYGSIDPLGEYIRTLDSYSPGSLARYLELSIISEQLLIPRAELMIMELHQDNQIMIQLLNDSFAAATEENRQGICDFIATRLDSHEKWGWQLRSILKVQRE